ncbi:hypothetical protein [Streptomyces erythrochromogenes]|uniref:hypothetical protein n=1 Tax=Streptomyces erythrochromogenes TaxID=285574 RepID=UPI0036BD8392
MNSETNNSDDGLQLLVGMEVSAVSFVRDYVELHFDGPVLRALSNPTGVYGGREWRFPEAGALDLMHGYIGRTVEGCQEDSGRALALRFGEHLFVIPLDDGSSLGPESAHLVGVDEDGRTSPLGGMWIW